MRSIRPRLLLPLSHATNRISGQVNTIQHYCNRNITVIAFITLIDITSISPRKRILFNSFEISRSFIKTSQYICYDKVYFLNSDGLTVWAIPYGPHQTWA